MFIISPLLLEVVMRDMLAVAAIFGIFISSGVLMGALGFVSAAGLGLIGLAMSMVAWWRQA